VIPSTPASSRATTASIVSARAFSARRRLARRRPHLQGRPQPGRRNDARPREIVHAFISNANDPVRPVHIAEALDANLTAVSRALGQLEESGEVRVTKVNGADGRGRWYSPADTSTVPG